MRILYLSQYFPPEVGATQTRAYEMAHHLATAGHHVTVITEFPNHPKGIIPSEYRGKLYEHTTFDDIEVIRVWVKTSPTKTFWSRMAFYLSYMLNSTIAGLFLARGQYDVLYATSPPLFVGGAALALSYLRRIPLFFEVRDLWPESAIEMGELSNPKIISVAKWLEKACYGRAKQIVVVTQGIFKRLADRGYTNKMTFIPNGANVELFQYRAEAGQALREKLDIQDKFVVIYAGIHGLAQGLETVIEAALKLTTNGNIHFLFVGEGPVKHNIVNLAQKNQLINITFHPEVPREQMPDFLSGANVALVPLRRLVLFQGALPSKMFDAWACQCPTLVSIDGEARQVLTAAKAGLYIEPENSEALVVAILQLQNDFAGSRQMGLNGRRIVTEYYSRQAQARQLERILTEILQKG
jgi:glycosyltransferase involved in cell wall biosynthesis